MASIDEMVTVCQLHHNLMQCKSCQNLVEIKTEYMTKDAWKQGKNQKRTELLSNFKITDQKQQKLIDALCLKDATDVDNFGLILNTLEGWYSEIDSELNGCVTLAQHLKIAGYEDMIHDVVKGVYEHDHQAECIDDNFY